MSITVNTPDTQIKLTVEELNEAYKQAKVDGEKINNEIVSTIVGRDPLTLRNINKLLNEDLDLPIILKLRFEFYPEIGRKGHWICISDIDVIDIDNY